MTAHAATPAALQRPPQPGRVRAVFLALMVHAAFFALIVFGVSWQSAPHAPIAVELWEKLPQAAPPEVKPPEPPPPDPVKPDEPPPPEPVKPVEPPPPPKKAEQVKPEPPKPAAEINEKLERQKREKEKRERLERERLDRLEKQKALEAKKRQEDEARKKLEVADKKKRDDEKRRRDEEAARREAEKAREAAATAQKTEIDRFINAIQAKIRQRANVPDTVRGNPEVHVLIKVLPGGDVLDITITKRSGNPAYDSAIERGIRSATPLPVPKADSELFPRFRELNLQIRHER